MCEKLESENGVFIYLNHQALINDAFFRTNGKKKYEILPALFDFRAKDDIDAENEPKRKRKNQSDEKVIDTDILLSYDSIKSALLNLVKNSISAAPQMPRVWEEMQSNDFPKFKGANHTTQFQLIDNLVRGKRFLIPPNTQFYNYDVADLKNFVSELPKFDLIVLDPPWRNKYIRRLKKHSIGYNMLRNEHLKELPIQHLINTNSIAAIWCTNNNKHKEALLTDLLPAWNLRILHTVKWLKLNTMGHLISTPLKNIDQKQPYEHLYIACHRDAASNFGVHIKKVDFILSVPSIIHSHKPPLLAWIQSYIHNLDEDPKCLELFARYLQPHFTSFGLEVLKLMDSRLYKDSNGAEGKLMYDK